MRKPHAVNAGYVCELKAKLGGHIVVYRADEAGISVDAGNKWVVMHEPSSNHVAVRSMRDARGLMKGLARSTTLAEARQHADVFPRPGSNSTEADDDGAQETLKREQRYTRPPRKAEVKFATRNRPVTPLPWTEETFGPVVCLSPARQGNMEYAIFAANAYPKLIVTIERLRAALRANGAPNCEAMKETDDLLIALGEPS